MSFHHCTWLYRQSCFGLKYKAVITTEGKLMIKNCVIFFAERGNWQSPKKECTQIFFSYFDFLGNIHDRQDHILQLLDMHCGSDQIHNPGGKDDVNPGYLVLMKCNFCDEKALNWSGKTIYVKPTAETTISLSQIEVCRCNFRLLWLTQLFFEDEKYLPHFLER